MGINELYTQENNILEWFDEFIDTTFETKFKEFITSPEYIEWLELEKIEVEWICIHNKIMYEEKQKYSDKYRISRLSDKIKEWTSKWSDLNNFYQYKKGLNLKNKIWDNFCEKFSQDFYDLDSNGLSASSFINLIFDNETFDYINFKNICRVRFSDYSPTCTNQSFIDKQEQLKLTRERQYYSRT